MKIKTLALSVVATVSSTAAMASTCASSGINCPAVPEISALEGTAAIAMVLAVVAIAWERTRRA